MNHLRLRRTACVVFVFCSFLVTGCDSDEPPPVGDDDRNCGGRGPCPEGTECQDGRCHGVTSSCCGLDCVACEHYELCTNGVCECQPSLATDDTLCGCSGIDDQPVDCRAGRFPEVCDENYQCACDESFHRQNDEACGCATRLPCPTGHRCQDSDCVCVPALNLENSADCACDGACLGGRTCQAGVCVCPAGETECGQVCLPADTVCCDRGEGVGCGPGFVCDRFVSGATCRPADSIACRDDLGNLLFACAADELCVDAEIGGRTCVDRALEICRNEAGQMTHTCPAESTCLPRGRCLREGETVCGDGLTVCAADRRCENMGQRFVCHSVNEIACHQNGVYVGACQPGERCDFGPLGRWDGCIPEGWASCYDEAHVRTHACPPHLECAQPVADEDDPRPHAGCVQRGEQVCADGETICGADEVCERAVDGMTCRPLAAVPCYGVDGLYLGRCPVGESCQRTGGGFICRPQDTIACYNETGDYTRACRLGERCTLDGVRCVPAESIFCEDGTVCMAGEQCRRSVTGTFMCQPEGTNGCYDDDKAYLGHCPDGQTCERQYSVSEPVLCRPSDVVPCYDRAGFYYGACGIGTVCLPGGDMCLLPSDTVCADRYTVCSAGELCTEVENSSFCRPAESVPCFEEVYGERRIAHWCDSGEVCAQRGPRSWTCRPEDSVACHDASGYLRNVCNAGWSCTRGGECVAPGHTVCGDGVRTCGPGELCQRNSTGRYDCRPEGTTPCFRGGQYRGFCQADDQCVFGRNGALICVPRGDFELCYTNAGGGLYVRHYCYPGWTCSDTTGLYCEREE